MSVTVPVLLGVVVLVLALAGPREPVFEGRRLSAWLKELHIGSLLLAERERVMDGIHSMGPGAVPTLLRLLQREDGGLKRVETQIASRLSLRHHVDSAANWNTRAVWGFQILGAEGEAAIPSLIALVTNQQATTSAHWGDVQYNAEYALAAVGRPAVAPLAELLDHADARVRVQAAFTLGLMPLNGSDAGPSWNGVLLSCYAGPRRTDHHEAAMSALTNALHDADENVRFQAARGLGNFDVIGSPAIPALLTAAQDPAEEVRKAASDSIRRLRAQADTDSN